MSKHLPWWLRMFKRPRVSVLPVWQRLDTKYQWEPGERHKVQVEHEGQTYVGYVYAIDLYSIVLYDEKGYRIGSFPKESMTKLLN